MEKADSCSRGGTTNAAGGKLYLEEDTSDKLLRAHFFSGGVMTSLERNGPDRRDFRSGSAKMSCGVAWNPVLTAVRGDVSTQTIGA